MHLVFEKHLDTIDAGMATTIIQSFPEATKRKDKWGRTALHTAIQYRAPLEAIQKLINVGPEALEKKDVKGRTPLHQALEKKASNVTIMAVLEAFPMVRDYLFWWYAYLYVSCPEPS